MIAIATGFDALDKKIEELFIANGINDLQIVNYREFLIQQPFETIIMSKNLVGQVELEYLVLSLRERNERIIYLTNEKDLHELKTCLDYGVYDLIFDPIAPQNVIDVYKVPKTFADVKKIFMIVNSPDNKQKTKDIEKLVKMGEMQHVSLIQNQGESYDSDRSNQSQNQMQQNQTQQNQMQQNQIQTNMNNNGYGAVQGDGYNGQMNNMPGIMPSMPSQNVTPTMPMQGMQTNVTNQNSMPLPANTMAPQSAPVQTPTPTPMNTQMPTGMQPQMPTSNQREVSPLSNGDFPSDSKKRVIRETQIESVYQIPNDYKKTIVIMSPESCGKTTLAVNMAWYYAKKGIKTTLIDTDIKKKDVYYNFPIETAECMSQISSTEDVTKLGISVDKNLKVYTEHKDVQVNLEIYDLVKLITASKRISQVVIVDLDYNLDSEMIKNVLEIADSTLVVVDQKVTTLNRIPEELYTYRNQLQSIDLVVNRFYNIRHLEKERVADFFRNIEIYNGKTFDLRVNRIFTVSDDAKSVLQGLAERTPTIEIRDNFLEVDIKEICDGLYIGEHKKKGFGF